MGVDIKSHEFRDATGSALTAFLMNGKRGVPGSKEVLKYCQSGLTLKRLEELMITTEFARKMEELGVPWNDAKGLTARQHMALLVITQPFDGKNFTARLREAGITSHEYRAWMQNPLFAGAVAKMSEETLANAQHLSHEALIKGLNRGDIKAVQYYNEMTGRYNPAKEAALDVKAVLVSVLEIIQRRVKDPETLDLIATDMQMLAARQHLSGEIVNGNNDYNQIGADQARHERERNNFAIDG